MALSRESIALRQSYVVFKRGVDPDTVSTLLYSELLLTPEEKGRTKERTLTTDQKLDEIFNCLERRVSTEPSVFNKLVKMLLEEPALERVGSKMQACYNDGIRIERVARKASQLQCKFALVLEKTKIEFSTKPTGFLNELRTTLTTLPVSPKFEGLQLLRKQKKCIMNAGNDGIFKILDRYWDYTDYALLQHLVERFGGGKLKKDMSEYVEALEQFEKKTTVKDSDTAASNNSYPKRHTYGGHEFSTVNLQLPRDPAICTLYEARQLHKSVAKRSFLEPYALHLWEVHSSSVVITLACPRAAIQLIVTALDEDFRETNEVISVTIDHMPLEEYSEEYVKGLQLHRGSEKEGDTTTTSLLHSGASHDFCQDGGEIDSLLEGEHSSFTDQDQVKIEASHLQHNFVLVVIHTHIEFSKKPPEFVEELRITLITLPLSDKFAHLKFLREERERIKNASSVNHIFEILENHWDYTDCVLLEHLVKDFGGDELKKEMKKYVTELEQLEKGALTKSKQHLL